MRQINLLNCIFLAGILAFGLFVLAPLLTVEVTVPAATTLKAPEEKKPEIVAQGTNPPQQDYSVIAEKNLFHPERIIPQEKKQELVVPRPEIVLYGTLIADNVKIAYLSDKKAPRTTPGRGKRQTSLKVGEILSGYTLTEVLTDRIVMVRGDDRLEIKVLEPANKKDRAAEMTPTGIPAASPPMTTPAQKAAPSTRLPVVPPTPIVGTTPSTIPKTRRVDTNAMKQYKQSLINQTAE